MKHFTTGRVAIALLATAVVCLSQAAVASAGGGNSANAKLCQKGGWQALVRSDGSSFASEEQCVSYAAQGGTLAQPASISTYVQVSGVGFQRVGVMGNGFTPNTAITFSESGLGPFGSVLAPGTVTSDPSGDFDSAANDLTNFWVLGIECRDGPQTIQITATDGTHAASTTYNFAGC
jgi:hypothetical protein